MTDEAGAQIKDIVYQLNHTAWKLDNHFRDNLPERKDWKYNQNIHG